MGLEIILLIVGLIAGFFIAKHFFSKQKWSDKEEALNEKWKRQISELEKEYLVKFEKNNSLTQQIKDENKLRLEEINRKWQVRYIQDMEELKKNFKDSEKIIRMKSVSSSRRSLVGKFIERFIPFLKEIPYEPADMHFLGSPIDYIVFEGLHKDNVEKIIFVEVKTGESKLTKRERGLKEAVEKKKVEWKEMNIDTKEEKVPDKEIESEEDLIKELYEKIDDRIKKVR